MTYILDTENEFDRLERQSLGTAYDYRTELQGLSVPNNAKILDAGCGSGIVSRFLARKYTQAEIIGCDCSQSRITQASQAAQHFPNLLFQSEDLTQLSFSSNGFDLVICRYVFQHLSIEKRAKVLQEFLRILKPGGQFCIIDNDGFILNLYPRSSSLESSLEKLRSLSPVDFLVGRKIPSECLQAGFENVAWRIETNLFQKTELDQEREMMRERFDAVHSVMGDILGGKKACDEFIDEYLKAMQSNGAVYFQNKFIVTGKKQSGLTYIPGNKK